MVARIITGKSIRGALSYNEQKVREGQAELLLAAGYPQEPDELPFSDKLRRFERLLEKAPRVKTNAVHISLNFDPGERLPQDKLIQIATAYMHRIGFDRQPFLVYRHLDAGHPHLHIVTTNIRPDGSRINLHNIGREKSEPARKALEQEFGLVQAETRKQHLPLPLPLSGLEKATYGKAETKRAIARVVTAVTGSYNVTSLAELNAVLRCFGITADRGAESSRMYQRKGLVYSILDGQGEKVGVPIKASSLPGKPTLANLEKLFIRYQANRGPYRAAVRQQVDAALQRAQRDGHKAFISHLHQASIQVLFRENAQGIVYGVTFLDHLNRVVLNGSELGRGYSAKGLFTRLRETGQAPSGMTCPPWEKGQPVLPAISASPAPGEGSGVAPGAGDDILRELLQAQQAYEYLPQGLRPKRRKRKKKYPTL